MASSSGEAINEHESPNLFGLESEAPSIASTSSDSSSIAGDQPKKVWSHSEIISKLKSGEFKEIENTKSRKDFWKRFKEMFDKDGQKIGYARCKGCKDFLRYISGTSVLSRHTCHGKSAIDNTPRITGYFSKQQTVSAAAKFQFADAIAYFCAKDMRPFAVVDGKGFNKLITDTLQLGSVYGLVDVNHLIPDRATISRHIGLIATEMRGKLKNRIQPVFQEIGGAITLDFWTDDYHKKPYLSITGHYIDDNWQLINVLLGVFPWDANTRQTFETIPTFLYEKLDEFGLSDRSKIIFVTDEGSNLKKSLENEHRMNCTAHVLNTGLKNVFDKESNLSGNQSSEILDALSAIDACKSLVTFIRSTRVKGQLSKTVVPDVDTRWHSKIDMIESVLSAWDEIEEILIERDKEVKKNDVAKLDMIDRTVLELLLHTIKPFREAILQVETSSKYPTLPLVMLLYQRLLKSLAPVENNERWIESLKRKLRESIQRKLLISQDHLIATTLHPSYRKLDIEGVKICDKRLAQDAIREMIAGFDSSPKQEGESLASATAAKHPRIAADDLLDEFCTPDVPSDSNNEFDLYLSEPVAKMLLVDILDWWKVASNKYPKLSRIARKYLAVPATSAASESVFRYAGLMVTELRNCLKPETVSDLLFIHHFDDNT